jgi:[ribosomal protein S5]-alanine N-acetyltransferase
VALAAPSPVKAHSTKTRSPGSRSKRPAAAGVYLRAALASDEREFRALRLGSRRFHARWGIVPPRGIEPGSRRDFRLHLDRGRKTDRERWLVCLVESEAILGSFTIGGIRRGFHESAVLGYWIGASHAGKGYMREALQLVLRRAFVDLKLHRLEAEILPENEASRALVRGAGFQLEGVARQFARLGERWRDHERWALLAQDWRPRYLPQSRR